MDERLTQFQQLHPIAYSDALHLARQHHSPITIAIADGNVTMYFGAGHPSAPLGCRRFACFVVPQP
jgi:hypothetical protein